MDFSSVPHLAKAAVLLAGAFILYRAYIQLIVSRKRQAIAREKGTLPVPWLSEIKDRFMGLDIFLKNIRLIKAHRILEEMEDRFKREGVRTMHMKMLGRNVYFTIEPENLKIIQAVEFKKWSLGTRRKAGFRPLLGLGIFTTDGHDWQHSREMLRPNFARSQVGDLATFERHVSHLIQAVPGSDATVDLSELFFRLTMDSATEFLFGESTESLTKSSGEGFAEAFTRSQDFIAHLSRWGAYAKLFSANKQFEHDGKFVHDFVDYYVRKGLAKRSQLLQEKSNSENELLNILLAGRDTTASLLTNVWWLLSKRPDVWEKLQAEVSMLDGAQPTFEELKDMKYLKALLNETLRLYPVVPVNSREATEDTTLPVGGGPDDSAPILVPKGYVVSWSVYAMHRRKDYYGEDADEFRPERWLDDPATGKKGLRPGWEYLPFNGGPRICLGQQFALTEASYTTVRLCQAFSNIESRDSESWTEALTLTCVNMHGAKVALTPVAA